MSTNINLNLNQKPYFEDYDETKDFHQVLYKPAVAVQARELTQEQTILRNQLKRFGDHIFANGSKVLGGDLHLDVQYFFVKLQANYNGVAIVLYPPPVIVTVGAVTYPEPESVTLIPTIVPVAPTIAVPSAL